MEKIDIDNVKNIFLACDRAVQASSDVNKVYDQASNLLDSQLFWHFFRF